ncbi:DUF1239 domain containing protein [Nonlabens dokdonensis DSW-6]|uniref:DUF1239 domain containing protein n=2 Tax=Nonlabens dokdonensis TaxID=328515 RepID=L7WAF3_NONDD|nr:DUF1239 domain containing protein [Nonlabens dokdonensis DSW-6]
MEIASNEPVGEVENMLLKHTDSGLLKLSIKGKKMLDFSNDEFPFTKFPDGIEVKVYQYANNKTNLTTITADDGTLYDETNLIDLRDNVKIVTSDGNIFMGDQLYWDQKAKWIFTNQEFETSIVNSEDNQNIGKTTGTVLDANENLKKLIARDPDDTFVPKQNK